MKGGSGPNCRSKALSPNNVKIIAYKQVLSNCVFPGIFDGEILKEGAQLVERGINKIGCHRKYNST